MKRSAKTFRIISAVLLVMALLSFFAGCESTPEGTAVTGGNGGTTINGGTSINGEKKEAAPYKFENYDTLEITVSDKEKFVLTIEPELVDDVDPDNMRYAGYGDWHKDGVKYPVYFFEKDFDDIAEAPNGCKGYIIVYDFRRVAEYEVYVPDDLYAIAMFVSNSNDPMIKRWESGDVDFPSYSAKWKAAEKVSVETKKTK